jgi:hypothetical protein
MNQAQLIEQMLVALKNASSTPNQSYLHNTGGLLTAASNPNVFNAIYAPTFGIMSRLPVRSSRYTSETHEILTAIGAVSGSHPTTACDPGKIPGVLDTKKMLFPWSNLKLSTRTLALSKVGGLVSRGEFEDFRLIGDPSAVGNSTTQAGNVASALKSEYQKMMLETKMGWANAFGRLVITGNPSNNSGDYEEARGLAILVNSGLTDSSATTLPANVQPIVVSALTDNLDTQTTTAGPAAVAAITDAYRAVKYRAERTGLLPVTWEFAMPRNLFYALTDAWPCSYATVGCVGSAGNPVNLDAASMLAMRKEMQEGGFLWIDAERVRVNFDDGITETEGSGVDLDSGTGTFTASAYLIPIMAAGSEPVTFVEYFSFDNETAREFISMIGRESKFGFEQNGRFLWIHRENDECMSASMRERSRIVTKTPWLSVRFTSFRYKPTHVVAAAF